MVIVDDGDWYIAMLISVTYNGQVAIITHTIKDRWMGLVNIWE